MITDAELLKMVMERFPEADTDSIVQQFSLLKAGVLQANARLSASDAGQENTEGQDIPPVEPSASKKRYTRRSLVAKPEEALGEEHVQCCLCGRAFQNLTAKHLLAHGLTVEEYKRLCGYAPDQRLVSSKLLVRLQENARKAQRARCRRSQPNPQEQSMS